MSKPELEKMLQKTKAAMQKAAKEMELSGSRPPSG